MGRSVTLSVKGNLLAVTPVDPEIEHIVVGAASYQKRSSGGRSAQKFETCYLCSSEDGYMLTFAGLWARLCRAFDKAQFTVATEINLQKQLVPDIGQLGETDIDNLDGREDQVQVMGLVADHPGGFVVDAPTGWGKSYVITQLCQIFPQARIAVVSPGKEVTSMLYRRIKEKIRDVGQVGDGRNYISRITVCTAESLSKLRHNDWDLLLFDEVHRAGAPATANSISEVFKTAKCVGFSASPTGRSDGSDLVVEALFGPVVYKVNYATAAGRGDIAPIKVKMYRIEKGAPIMTDFSVVKNRHGLWRNDLRNAFIAKLAGEIPPDDQVLIMCATAEHVLYLRRYLPNFDVIFSDMNPKLLKEVYKGTFGHIDGMDSTGSITPGRRGYMRKEFESGNMKRVIATGIWNTGVDFKKLRWLIRADGMASEIQSIQTPGRLSRTSDGKEYGTLIDFMDVFDPTLLRRSNDRLRRYKKNGWDVEEIRDPDVCVQKFSDIRRGQCQTT
jgi:superfamily II DNA or RNA helicase